MASEEEQIARGKDNLKEEREFVLPPNKKNEEDEDEQPLIFKIKKLKESNGKDKLTEYGKQVTWSCFTRGSEIKLLVDVIRKNKSSSSKLLK